MARGELGELQNYVPRGSRLPRVGVDVLEIAVSDTLPLFIVTSQFSNMFEAGKDSMIGFGNVSASLGKCNQ
jgi:hypothetical protein